MGGVVDVVHVVHDKLYLVFMVDCCCESLEYKLFYLQGFSIGDTLNDSIKIFLVLLLQITTLAIRR